MEHPKEVGTKVYINGPDHMTKMAAMAINRKKNIFLQNNKVYDFETWHEAQGKELYIVYINHDPGMTLTYFTARST